MANPRGNLNVDLTRIKSYVSYLVLRSTQWHVVVGLGLVNNSFITLRNHIYSRASNDTMLRWIKEIFTGNNIIGFLDI